MGLASYGLGLIFMTKTKTRGHEVH